MLAPPRLRWRRSPPNALVGSQCNAAARAARDFHRLRTMSPRACAWNSTVRALGLPTDHIEGRRKFIARVRKIGAFVDELPVWPLDAGTLRKFLAAYMVPLVGGIPILATRIPPIRAILVYAHILPN